jgi:putative oxidoreductase
MVGHGLACRKMISRLLISLVFLVAGALKLSDPLAFADGIAAFHIFPGWSINPLAMGVPYFEIFTGAGILCGRTRSAAALAACGLSACFVVLYATALARGLDVTCACFGKWTLLQASTRVGFVRALVLLGISVCALRGRWLHQERMSPERSRSDLGGRRL